MKIYIGKLDKLWSQAVRHRDKGVCQKCFKQAHPKGLQAHHIFTRSRHTTRWSLINGISLCSWCHTFGPQSAHKAPEAFRQLIKERIGESVYDDLEALSNKTTKDFPVDEKEAEIELKKVLDSVHN